jgi:8-oxo-dGTP pyrophosphatase MutT (NUDIX family)
MAKLLYGDRIGRDCPLKVGCAAVIFDATRRKILLTQRSDNGRWCLPGGAMEPGETAAEACIREVWEETGLQVEVVKLIGVYTSPHRVTAYVDGNRFQFVSFSFEAVVVAGTLGLSEETTAYDYFSLAEMTHIDVMEHHLERIMDALADQAAAFIR